MKLKGKIISLNLSSIIVLGILIAGVNFYFISKQLKEVSVLTREKMMAQKEEELSHLVAIVESIISTASKEYPDDKDKAKEVFLKSLEGLRYSSNGYYFGYDTLAEPITYAFHGVNHDWRGTVADLDKVDQKGFKYLKEMILGSMEKGSNYVSYYFNNPASNQVEEKLAYAVYLKDYNLVVATGFYIDDINKNIDSLVTGLKILFSKQGIITNLIFLVVTVILVVISIIFSNKIINPINLLKGNLEKIADGDLNVDTRIDTKDEIGELGDTFNQFSNKLRGTIKKIKVMSLEVEDQNMKLAKIMDNIVYGNQNGDEIEVKGTLKKGITHLNSQMEQVLDNVRNQTASSEESLASLEQISSTSENMASNTQKAATDFNETKEIINNNLNDIKNMSDGMEGISTSVEKTNTEIEKLKNLSVDIENIVYAINGISEQTNLLALNAAIEAARAGEAGRGFAVVADEIRKLAEGTGEETKKIENIINIIQKEVDNVKSSGDISFERVAEGLKLMEISRENTIKISELTESNNNQINEIMNSSHEQSIASREITTAITTITESSIQIESLSHDTSKISEEIQDILIEKKKTIEELYEMAKELKQDLDFFKV